ncbi:MAG TPA: hypothetical protein VD993_13400 [Chitinophagaceae bacterium]|nr:hypothetical protein [Chitinophagaceae bacterium]
MITSQKKTLKVGKYVNTEHVDTVIRTYKQERWAQNSDRIGKEDSLSAWYSVEELENFIDLIKQHGADGLKIYFGAYPENFAEVPEYAGRQTVVLVGTKRKQTENGKSADKDIYVHTEKGSQILAYNMARICPPFCGGSKDDGTDFGEGLGITIVDRKDKGWVVV